MKYYNTNIGGSEETVAMSEGTLDHVWSSHSNGQGELLQGFYLQEVSLSDDQFVDICKSSYDFSKYQQTRNGRSPFTEQEEWDGASPALEMFNLSTENWVEIYGPSQ